MERQLEEMLIKIFSSDEYNKETKMIIRGVMQNKKCSIEAKIALIQACIENKNN